MQKKFSGKLVKLVHRCQILRPKCTKLDFRWGFSLQTPSLKSVNPIATPAEPIIVESGWRLAAKRVNELITVKVPLCKVTEKVKGKAHLQDASRNISVIVLDKLLSSDLLESDILRNPTAPTDLRLLIV